MDFKCVFWSVHAKISKRPFESLIDSTANGVYCAQGTRVVGGNNNKYGYDNYADTLDADVRRFDGINSDKRPSGKRKMSFRRRLLKVSF